MTHACNCMSVSCFSSVTINFVYFVMATQSIRSDSAAAATFVHCCTIEGGDPQEKDQKFSQCITEREDYHSSSVWRDRLIIRN